MQAGRSIPDPPFPIPDMQSRRAFVSNLARAGVAVPVFKSTALASVLRAEAIALGRTATSLAEDESYWGEIQRAFDADRTLINLNNGGVSPTPSHVLEAMIRDLRFSNELPVEHMWGVLEPRIESVRRELAKEFGCDPEEGASTRNASEANETMILGLDLARGDEVILTTQNYPRMKNAWIQRERRDGIVIKWVKLETPPRSPEYYVQQIAAAITPRTKVIETMHISFMTGYIAPVRQAVELARPRGTPGRTGGAGAAAAVAGGRRTAARGGDHAAHQGHRDDAYQFHDRVHRARAAGRRARAPARHSGVR